MRLLYSFTLSLILNTALNSCFQNSTKEKSVVTNNSNMADSSIAVIPFDRSGNWPFNNNYTPASLTEKEIKEIDSLINISISEHNRSLSKELREFYGIDLKKYKYKRQYVAVINGKGEKEIWVNAFCSTMGDKWKKEILLVEDGGNCFFNLKVNLKTKKCFGLSVNGYA